MHQALATGYGAARAASQNPCGWLGVRRWIEKHWQVTKAVTNETASTAALAYVVRLFFSQPAPPTAPPGSRSSRHA